MPDLEQALRVLARHVGLSPDAEKRFEDALAASSPSPSPAEEQRIAPPVSEAGPTPAEPASADASEGVQAEAAVEREPDTSAPAAEATTD